MYSKSHPLYIHAQLSSGARYRLCPHNSVGAAKALLILCECTFAASIHKISTKT